MLKNMIAEIGYYVIQFIHLNVTLYHVLSTYNKTNHWETVKFVFVSPRLAGDERKGLDLQVCIMGEL